MSAPALIDFDRILEETWSRLHAAAGDRTHPMRLCTLATTTIDHRPDARLLLLRGAHRESASLWFHCDRRSRKIRQIEHLPRGCAVVYDSRDGVQLRIAGSLVIRTDDAVADQHWQQLEMVRRFGYRAPDPPGDPQTVRDPRMDAIQRAQDVADADHGRENFVVLELCAESIEWLQVGAEGDRRAECTASNDWQVRPLNP